MKTILILAVLVGGAAGVTAYQHSENRSAAVQDWSSDDVQVTAAGPLNQVLFVALTASGQVECQSYVDGVVNDAKLARELSGYGFRAVQCGDIREKVDAEILKKSQVFVP